ncbi:probable serine/threonine-protein kinase kinX isoform X2 [Eurosta solidaginis]|uniref:probable serine/threonine-protein kinase kinX isoform X2 n=1 Tax=Eurosta solidaginis TaxID=178769 RepID=UPI003530D2DA
MNKKNQNEHKMSDTLTRVKLQLRPVNGSVLNGNGTANGDDKTPTSPATKLLINHGKPNYTIQRSPKAQHNGATNPLNNDLQNNNRNNYYPYKSAGVVGTSGIVTNGYSSKTKITTNNNNGGGSSNSSQNGDDLIVQSTKFNGVFKAVNVPKVESRDELDTKVTLRRVQRPTEHTTPQNGNDENVPEFILRQRRIQERLANENLDFENRRSGYFTQVVISPTSPNRFSMVETMSSPPIVPSLEMPPPAKEESIVEESSIEVSAAHANGVGQHVNEEKNVAAEKEMCGHIEEEEVAKAIEEVNKAVADEKIDEKADVVEVEGQVEREKEAVGAKAELEEEKNTVVEHKVEEQKEEEHKVEEHKVEEQKEQVHKEDEKQHLIEATKVEELHVVQPETSSVLVVVTRASVEEVVAPQVSPSVADEPTKIVTAETTVESAHKETAADVVVVHNEEAVEVPQSHEPAIVEQPKENGHAAVTEEVSATTDAHVSEEVTISHTNGLAKCVSIELLTPSLPIPDPSGALGVNYEPKTVVSFSKDLGAPNNYPDTVKVVKTKEGGVEAEASSAANEELKEMAKLKFDIKADDNDVQVTSTLRTD